MPEKILLHSTAHRRLDLDLTHVTEHSHIVQRYRERVQLNALLDEIHSKLLSVWQRGKLSTRRRRTKPAHYTLIDESGIEYCFRREEGIAYPTTILTKEPREFRPTKTKRAL